MSASGNGSVFFLQKLFFSPVLIFFDFLYLCTRKNEKFTLMLHKRYPDNHVFIPSRLTFTHLWGGEWRIPGSCI